MNEQPVRLIGPDDRGMAAVTHLSGLAGYIVPLGGVLVPIVIWIVKKESRTIAAIAKQALLLNVAVFVASLALLALSLTIILIPVTVACALALGIVAIVLPVVGAIRASEGSYFRYPLVGMDP